MEFSEVSKRLFELNKNEEDLKIKWLNPLLEKAGWSVTKISGEKIIWAEVTGSAGRVDYALKLNNRIVACLELKAPSKDIFNDGVHRNQALKYASSYYYTNNGRLDPIMAICTNGLDAFIMDPGISNATSLINSKHINLRQESGVLEFINLIKSIKEDVDGSLPGISTKRKFDLRPYASPTTDFFEKEINKFVKELKNDGYTVAESVEMTIQVLLLAAARDNGIIPNRVILEHSEKKEWANLATHLNKLFGDVFEVNLGHGKANDIWKIYSKTSYLNVRLDILPAQYMGTIYEKIVRKHFKNDTSYYTPEDLIETVLKNCNPTLEDSILDPTCGSGAFLSKAIDYASKGKVDQKKLLSFFNNIVGVDKDPIACKIAKVTLLCTFMRKVGEDYQRSGKPLPRPQIKPAVDFFEWNGGQFSLVLGNPPWAPIDKLSRTIKDYISYRDENNEYTFSSYQNKNDQLCYIVEKAIENHLRPNGRFGFVIKQQSLLSVNSERFVEYLNNKAEYIKDFGAESKFHNYAQSSIICGKKSNAQKWTYSYSAPLEIAKIKGEEIAFNSLFVSTRGAQPGGEIKVYKTFASNFPNSIINKKVPERLRLGGEPKSYFKIAFQRGKASAEFMNWLNKNKKFKLALEKRAIIRETVSDDNPKGRDPYSWPRDSVENSCYEKILITDRNSTPGEKKFPHYITNKKGKWLSADKHTVISSEDPDNLYLLGALLSSNYFFSLCRRYKLIPRRAEGIFLNPVTLQSRLKIPLFKASDRKKLISIAKVASLKNREISELEIARIDVIFKRYLILGKQLDEKHSYTQMSLSEYLYPQAIVDELDDVAA